MKCIYHNDNDGRCAAYLVSKFCDEKGVEYEESVDFIEMNYDRELPIDQIGEGEEVWMVDFHLEKPDEAAALYDKVVKHGGDIIWIDHHITAIEGANEEWLALPGIRDTRWSGAMLTWAWTNGYEKEKIEMLIDSGACATFIRVVDDWDCWKHKMQETRPFKDGSEIYETHPLGNFWPRCWGVEFIFRVCEEGKIIQKAIAQRAEEQLKSFGFWVKFEGCDCIVLNQGMCNSTWFDSIIHCDIMMPFYFNGDGFTVSLYSTTVDVSVIAKKYGGGGHKQAAGFTCKELPFKKFNPR